MKIKRKTSVFICFMMLLTALFATPVMADNAGLTPNDSQVITKEKLTNKEKEVQTAKEKELDELSSIFEQTVMNGGDLSGEYLTKLKKYNKKWEGTDSEVAVPEKSTTESITPKTIYSSTLGVSTYAQQTLYYCGPASAYQLMKYKGITTNPQDGRALSQDNLASDLETDSGGTDFTGTWLSTLQNWTNRTFSATWSPSASTVYSRTYNNVNSNWPLIYDCYMSSTRGYLTGYTSGSYYHYVTGDGWQYNDSDPTFKQCHYVDPNQYKSAAYGPHWTSASNLSNMMQGLGLLY